MVMHVLITGGTGFIGKKLVEELLNEGCKIIVLSRRNNTSLGNVKFIQSLESIDNKTKIDQIINLAGAPISKRWTEKYKIKLLRSRIQTTKNIIDLIERLQYKPQVFISASAIGYYGAQGDIEMNEASPPHKDFTHKICDAWEKEALKAEKWGVRVCIARLGVVLGKGGGALNKMLPPFKLCVGGILGNGNQYFSWVHIDDVINSFKFLLNSKGAVGIYNLTSPTPITNKEFTRALSHALKRPAILPMPYIVVKILFGEMGEALLLKGQRAVPKNLQSAGFKFTFQKIETALNHILSGKG